MPLKKLFASKHFYFWRLKELFFKITKNDQRTPFRAKNKNLFILTRLMCRCTLLRGLEWPIEKLLLSVFGLFYIKMNATKDDRVSHSNINSPYGPVGRVKS
jgi:hypothetical protein